MLHVAEALYSSFTRWELAFSHHKKSKTGAKFQDIIRSQIRSVFQFNVWHLPHGHKMAAAPQGGEENTCVSGRKKKKVMRRKGEIYWEANFPKTLQVISAYTSSART